MSLLLLVQEDKEFDIVEVNIEDDDELHEKYMMKIPVVEQNGQIIQSGLLDYITLLEEIEG
ncbi:glutaredoxin family protein [Kurthia zopfii]|nr:glutaredoxin family protein [Kurthia zopfii]